MILNGERRLLLFFLHSLCIAGLENFGELIQQVVVFDLAKLLFAVLVFYNFKDVVLICVCNFALGVAQSGDKRHKVAVIVLEFVDDLKFVLRAFIVDEGDELRFVFLVVVYRECGRMSSFILRKQNIQIKNKIFKKTVDKVDRWC